MTIAITRTPSPRMSLCELEFVDRTRIDNERATTQHQSYCQLLKDLGVSVVTLPPLPEFPDSAFVEDVAIVLDEVAIMTSLGVASRRGETFEMESVLRGYREIQRIELPATIEGGDVLRVGKQLLVGDSSRTNLAGIECLRRLVSRYGYEVVPVPVSGCLHLKTACTSLDETSLLVNSNWIDTRALTGYQLHHVSDDEPWGANGLQLNQTICMSAAHSKSREYVQQLGYKVHTVELTEFARAEAGITCLGLLFDHV